MDWQCAQRVRLRSGTRHRARSGGGAEGERAAEVLVLHLHVDPDSMLACCLLAGGSTTYDVACVRAGSCILQPIHPHGCLIFSLPLFVCLSVCLSVCLRYKWCFRSFMDCRCLLHYLNEPRLGERCNARFFIDQRSKRVFAQTLVVRTSQRCHTIADCCLAACCSFSPSRSLARTVWSRVVTWCVLCRR